MSGRDDYNVLAPEFAITVDGAPLPVAAASDLISLSVLDDVDAPGMFTLTVAAWDTAQMLPKWIDDRLFDVGGAVEIALGYRDHTTRVFAGEITGLEPDFPEGGAPTLTVRGHDRRHRLTRGRKTRSYTNLKDSDIADQIASQAGLRPSATDSGQQLAYVLQHNQTDLEFLAERARRLAFEVVVRDRDLLFRPRNTAGGATFTLHRDIDLIAFRPRLSTLAQVTQVQVRGWDPSAKKEIVGNAGLGDEAALLGKTSGPSTAQRASAAAPAARVDMPVRAQGEADDIAKRNFAEMAMRYIRAEAVCIGDPRIVAGVVVGVDGLGTRFSGDYYVTSVEHTFRPQRGYRTTFSAMRNAS